MSSNLGSGKNKQNIFEFNFFVTENATQNKPLLKILAKVLRISSWSYVVATFKN